MKAAGFNWLHNYWCDLLSMDAGNGKINPARPAAMLAMVLLGSVLAFFWYRLAGFLDCSPRMRALIRASGIISMATAFLLFTPFHDTALAVSGGTGFVVLVATMAFLRQNNLIQLFHFGAFCVGLVAVNNLIYWSKTYLEWLPLVQKITFCAILYWVASISLLLKRRRDDRDT
ncbi:MAG: hypothetical protein IPM98_05995 [Lewinellaceae bacterium]|nr:hypothetical protein [Lewinellaceae bacterium]